MKTLRLPVCLFAALYTAFLLYIMWSAPRLPATVASHFDINGQPDGWMNRSTVVTAFGVLGLIFPLVMVAIFWALRFAPASLLNIPHKAYWLVPERRSAMYRYLYRHSWWLACLEVSAIAGAYGLTVHANSSASTRLSPPLIILLTGGFFLGMAGWIFLLARHFAVPAGVNPEGTQPQIRT